MSADESRAAFIAGQFERQPGQGDGAARGAAISTSAVIARLRVRAGVAAKENRLVHPVFRRGMCSACEPAGSIPKAVVGSTLFLADAFSTVSVSEEIATERWFGVASPFLSRLPTYGEPAERPHVDSYRLVFLVTRRSTL